jgi:adenosylmethionine-8-amino-7-oxononanoate aminotransferase
VEVLNIFRDEAMLQQIQPRMAQLKAAGEEFGRLEGVGEFRQCGMVAAVEMVRDKASRTGYPWQERRGLEVYREALREGALLRPLGNVVYFMPPLSIQEEELAELLAIAYRAVVKVTEG